VKRRTADDRRPRARQQAPGRTDNQLREEGTGVTVTDASVDTDHPLTGWYRQSTPKVRRVFWTCTVAWGLDSMDGFVYQYLIPALVAGLGLTLAQAGSIASANYFAAAIGGWTGGWLADRYGRARVLQVTILWFSIFSFLSGFAQDYTQLLALRTLQGFGFGAEWAVGAVLLGELVTPAHRGKAIGAVQSAAGPGSALAALLAGPVAAMLPITLGWRVAFWIGVLPALLVFFVRKEDDDAEIYKRARARAQQQGRTFLPVAIFTPKLRRRTAAACLLALGAQGAGFAVSNYLTTFLHEERGLSLSVAGIYVLFNSAGGFFGFLTNAYVGDRLGRRRAFRYFAAGFIIAVNFYIFAPLGSSAFTLLPAGFVYGFFQFGIYASFGPYFTELFPTEVRATGQSFSYNFGRAASALFIQGVALLHAYMPISAGMVIMSVTAQLCAIVATLMLPETAGRELTDMDSSA
jgi:MFS family permease